jgi:hypothetical protein
LFGRERTRGALVESITTISLQEIVQDMKGKAGQIYCRLCEYNGRKEMHVNLSRACK